MLNYLSRTHRCTRVRSTGGGRGRDRCRAGARCPSQAAPSGCSNSSTRMLAKASPLAACRLFVCRQAFLLSYSAASREPQTGAASSPSPPKIPTLGSSSKSSTFLSSASLLVTLLCPHLFSMHLFAVSYIFVDHSWMRIAGIPGLDESHLPRYIGIAFGFLIILNHVFSASPATPAQLVIRSAFSFLKLGSAYSNLLGRF
ncbi:hypothetical protein B296_00051199 [Ensete ventricosum]|uniref:Uncharacterized protein n=1 Tax=Ensete ventricosum TaxID=4639 RepID=A0A426Y4M3_ENSVE|nr:hypothetical protein B296_00051199 [Ensete ventricosum]